VQEAVTVWMIFYTWFQVVGRRGSVYLGTTDTNRNGLPTRNVQPHSSEGGGIVASELPVVVAAPLTDCEL
jgi:hypothetical protein